MISGVIVRLTSLSLLSVCYFIVTGRASPVQPVLLPREVWNGTNETGSAIFASQFSNPSEVFSVLLIIGGDIIQTAIAQRAGHKLTLIAFSFGWVAYSVTALMAAFGDGGLMPDPDIESKIITCPSGSAKANNSWVVGRLIRDLERRVIKEMETWYEQVDVDDGSETFRTTEVDVTCKKVREDDSALVVTICRTNEGAGSPKRDHKSTCIVIGVIFLQLIVSTIPILLHGNWSIFFLTAIGNTLAVLTASLKEWRLEKYKARRKAKLAYAITRGNGHPHVFVIKPGEGPNDLGLNLEDLAGSIRKADRSTRVKTFVLASFWIVFLIAAGASKEDAWFLLGVGLLGMIHNIWEAGRHRPSASHGLPLTVGETFGRKKIEGKVPLAIKMKRWPLGRNQIYRPLNRPKGMPVLMCLETFHHGIGESLVPEFFPKLSKDEEVWWKQAKLHRKEAQDAPKGATDTSAYLPYKKDVTLDEIEGSMRPASIDNIDKTPLGQIRCCPGCGGVAPVVFSSPKIGLL